MIWIDQYLRVRFGRVERVCAFSASASAAWNACARIGGACPKGRLTNQSRGLLQN
jgi:hypothetical protein